MSDSIVSPPAPPSRATQRAIIFLATIQGVLLLGMHELLVRDLWPGTSLPLRTLWYTLVLTLPTAACLLMRDLKDRRLWWMLLAYGLLLVPMSLYTGAQVDPARGTEPFQFFLAFGISQSAVWFVAAYLMELKLEGESLRDSAQDVCAFSWRHGLALGLLLAFLGVLWMLLHLWAALFGVIGIGFFQELFDNRRFIYPAFGIAVGFAVVVLRGQFDAVGFLERIASALFRVLLPLLALIVLMFLAALPFTGVHLLWHQGLGTPLMMWLMALMLVFVNVSFHGRPAAYPVWLRWPVYAATAVLPACFALSAWGMGLRIAERGWSFDRLWGAVVLGLLGLFVLSYAVAILRFREAWLERLPRINRVAGILAAGILVLTSLPVLNLSAIAAHSQVARLLDGRVSPDEFDYSYLRFQLGEPGYEAALALEHSAFMAAHPAALARLTAVDRATSDWTAAPPTKPADIATRFDIPATAGTVPPEALAAMAGASTNAHCFMPRSRCTVLRVDLRGDGSPQFLVYPDMGYGFDSQPVYALVAGKWQVIAVVDAPGGPERKTLEQALETGRYRLDKPQYPDIVVGGMRIAVRPKP